MSTAGPTPTVVFCCDAGPTIGVGHVMRGIALAEELVTRGLRPEFCCDTAELPWAGDQLRRRGFTVHPPPADVAEYVAAVRAAAPVAVVLDSYLLPPQVSRALRETGTPVVAVVDGELRGHEADLYVDQNLGAAADCADQPAGATRLAGLAYAMLRDDVVRARPAAPATAAPDVPRVLAFFGGTDAFGAAPVLTSVLASTGRPFDATVVAASSELAAQVRAVATAPAQRVAVISPTDAIADLAATADLVLAASGTTTWELLCLGAAAAVVYAAENQLVGYRCAVATGAVVGLGSLAEVRADPVAATDAVRGLLTDPDGRAALRRKAWHLVDGRGRARVADTLLGLITGG